MPWWVCPLTAAIVYITLNYALPLALARNSLLEGFSLASRLGAPFAAGFVLLIGSFALLSRRLSGRLLDRQTGVDSISELTWEKFEHLIAAAFRREGYAVVTTSSGADGGVDLVLKREGEKVLVQCKHWRSKSIGVRAIREFHGVVHSKQHLGSRGVFVTSGSYTREAVAFAKQNGMQLIDRHALLKMIRSAQSPR